MPGRDMGWEYGLLEGAEARKEWRWGGGVGSKMVTDFMI